MNKIFKVYQKFNYRPLGFIDKFYAFESISGYNLFQQWVMFTPSIKLLRFPLHPNLFNVGLNSVKSIINLLTVTTSFLIAIRELSLKQLID